MKGILLLSHGDMAKAMLQSSSIFFGDDIKQVEALDFQMTDDCDLFEEKIGKCIERIDDGDGVIILTDLYAGTPAHKTTKYLSDGKVDVICGMNLPLFIELINKREIGEIDIDELVEIGQQSILPWRIINKTDDEFF